MSVLSETTSNSHVTAVKFVIAGGFGVGKTTFVGAISEVEPLTTEAPMTVVASGVDDHSAIAGTAKLTTTVAMDFGRLTVDESLVMYLFGAPGQERFTFMWDDLINGPWAPSCSSTPVGSRIVLPPSIISRRRGSRLWWE